MDFLKISWTSSIYNMDLNEQMATLATTVRFDQRGERKNNERTTMHKCTIGDL
jgi:hypothetical protein